MSTPLPQERNLPEIPRIQLPRRGGRPAIAVAPSLPNRLEPKFSLNAVDTAIPKDAELIDERFVDGSRVRIFSVAGGARALYHLLPWEHCLSLEQTEAVLRCMDKVRSSPPAQMMDGPDQLRRYVEETALRSLSPPKGRDIMKDEMKERLARTVVRYTIGLGLLEHLILDERVEDVYMDAPADQNRWHVVLSSLGSSMRAETNIFGSEKEAGGLVSRLKQHSLKPFSEAIPVLETDVPSFDARATVMGPPLSPHGHALAFRRHSKRPWTLLRLVRQGALTVNAASLLSFLIDGRSSMLVCGPRGAGKSSLLSALLFEFHPDQRIVTIEDTLELPVRQMQQLGFKAQSILVQPGLDRTIDESADDALRVSLRLGESALIVGEVRGREARTLFESMRTGKAGSSVLGTVHGDSSRSVFERVVHDLGVAAEAFSATDLVITLGLIRRQGSQRQERMVTEMAMLRRDAEPGSFTQMLDAVEDLEALEHDRYQLIERIAKGWGISYSEAVKNIRLRSELRNIVLEAQEASAKDLLGPEMVRACNEHLWAWTELRQDDETVFLNRFRQQVKGMM